MLGDVPGAFDAIVARGEAKRSVYLIGDEEDPEKSKLVTVAEAKRISVYRVGFLINALIRYKLKVGDELVRKGDFRVV